MDPLALLQELVSIPGPPGQEEAVRAALSAHVATLGLESRTDAKGNLIVDLQAGVKPKIMVTAHMDEIAMIVRAVGPDGSLSVTSLGGLLPWKLGEGPVEILTPTPFTGILSFGSIHTEAAESSVVQAKEGLTWDMVQVVTGLTEVELAYRGVRPGTRVVVARSRRTLTPIGNLIAGYFLDDRADLVSWLLALDELKSSGLPVAFVATASEEVGGEGALFYLHGVQPDVCIALELGPDVPDAPVELSDQPTVWAKDSYATMMASDGDLIAEVGQMLGMDLQFQVLSRGGSDASCAAGKGLCARPITLGLPMANTHGYEIMHPGAMAELARLAVGIVQRVLSIESGTGGPSSILNTL